LIYNLTGGPDNSDSARSLGGERSSAQLARSGSMEIDAESLFGAVVEDQSEADITEYRCIALTNNHLQY